MTLSIGPLCAWVCSYWKDGVEYGVTLYATDPDQIERGHPGIIVRGQLVGVLDA